MGWGVWNLAAFLATAGAHDTPTAGSRQPGFQGVWGRQHPSFWIFQMVPSVFELQVWGLLPANGCTIWYSHAQRCFGSSPPSAHCPNARTISCMIGHAAQRHVQHACHPGQLCFSTQMCDWVATGKCLIGRPNSSEGYGSLCLDLFRNGTSGGRAAQFRNSALGGCAAQFRNGVAGGRVTQFGNGAASGVVRNCRNGAAGGRIGSLS